MQHRPRAHQAARQEPHPARRGHHPSLAAHPGPYQAAHPYPAARRDLRPSSEARQAPCRAVHPCPAARRARPWRPLGQAQAARLKLRRQTALPPLRRPSCHNQLPPRPAASTRGQRLRGQRLCASHSHPPGYAAPRTLPLFSRNIRPAKPQRQITCRRTFQPLICPAPTHKAPYSSVLRCCAAPRLAVPGPPRLESRPERSTPQHRPAQRSRRAAGKRAGQMPVPLHMLTGSPAERRKTRPTVRALADPDQAPGGRKQILQHNWPGRFRPPRRGDMPTPKACPLALAAPSLPHLRWVCGLRPPRPEAAAALTPAMPPP